KYDLEIHFYTPMHPNDVQTVIDQIPGIDISEGFVAKEVQISKSATSKTVPLYGYQANSALRKFSFDEGGFDGLVLGKNIAKQLDTKYGENVIISEEELNVKGIASELLADFAYLPLNMMQDLYPNELGNNITGIILTVENGFQEADIKQAILSSDLPVALVISTNDFKKSIEVLIQGLMALIAVMVFFGFVTVALFSFNTVVLDAMSREVEFVNLRSLGAGKRKVTKIIILQGLLISVVGSLLAIPMSYFITDWLIKSMVADIMVLPTVIKPVSYAAGILSAFLASLFGMWSAIRHVMKIDMVNALRTRVSN
ncbi:MAG: ABC transporter permease, partial [Candidatus Kariarchaeaceae archaeon]